MIVSLDINHLNGIIPKKLRNRIRIILLFCPNFRIRHTGVISRMEIGSGYDRPVRANYAFAKVHFGPASSTPLEENVGRVRGG